MKNDMEVNAEKWYAALKPQDAKNVRELIPVVASRIERYGAIFTAVGSSVRKARGEKNYYRDIDFAIASENLRRQDSWFEGLVKGICDKLDWDFLDSKGSAHNFRSAYPTFTRYALNDSIGEKVGGFTGSRIRLCPNDGPSSRSRSSKVDLMLVSGSKFGEREYGNSIDDWLKAQKEQALPYVVLARF